MSKERLVQDLIAVRDKINDIIRSMDDATQKDTFNPVLILNTGEELAVPQEWISEWSASYTPSITVAAITEACQWAKDNPAKRKTPRGARKFLGSWILRNYQKDKNTRKTPTELLAGKYTKKHGAKH